MIQHITVVNRGCASRGVHATRVSLYHNQSKSFPKSITFYTLQFIPFSLLDVFAALVSVRISDKNGIFDKKNLQTPHKVTRHTAVQF